MLRQGYLANQEACGGETVVSVFRVPQLTSGPEFRESRSHDGLSSEVKLMDCRVSECSGCPNKTVSGWPYGGNSPLKPYFLLWKDVHLEVCRFLHNLKHVDPARETGNQATFRGSWPAYPHPLPPPLLLPFSFLWPQEVQATLKKCIFIKYDFIPLMQFHSLWFIVGQQLIYDVCGRGITFTQTGLTLKSLWWLDGLKKLFQLWLAACYTFFVRIITSHFRHAVLTWLSFQCPHPPPSLGPPYPCTHSCLLILHWDISGMKPLEVTLGMPPENILPIVLAVSEVFFESCFPRGLCGGRPELHLLCSLSFAHFPDGCKESY